MQHPDVVGLNALVEEVESKNPEVIMKINHMAGNIARNGDDDVLNNWNS